MRRFNLSEMVQQKRRGRAFLPVVPAPVDLEIGYTKILTRFITKIGTGINQIILPMVRANKRFEKLTTDAGPGDFAAFESFLREIEQGTADQMNELSALAAQKHTKGFIRTVSEAIGVNLQGIIEAEDLAVHLEQAAARHAGLITDVSANFKSKVRIRVTSNATQGRSVASLTENLKRDLGVGHRRAVLIAKDQSHKLLSEFSQARHQQAGIGRYMWSSASDQRVRPLHSVLDGREYTYGQPTDAESGDPPGQPILCRCVAIGIVNFG